MKRLLLPAFAVGAFLVVSHAPAGIAPQPIHTYPFRNIVPPAQYVASAAGGPGVVLSEDIKSRVVVEYTGGGPCGGFGPTDSPNPPRDSDPETDARNAWITIGAVGAVFGVLTVAGLVLLRRTQV